MTILSEEEKTGNWWDEMSEKYGKIAIEGKPSYNIYARNGGMNFFRENKVVSDIVKMSKQKFRKATDEYIYQCDLFDFESDCGSGCTVF